MVASSLCSGDQHVKRVPNEDKPSVTSLVAVLKNMEEASAQQNSAMQAADQQKPNTFI